MAIDIPLRGKGVRPPFLCRVFCFCVALVSFLCRFKNSILLSFNASVDNAYFSFLYTEKNI